MSDAVKVLFASASPELISPAIERMQRLFPDLPLYVVAEFPPPSGLWIRYHIRRPVSENLALIRWSLKGRRVRLSAVILEPRVPYRRMRLAALLLAPTRFLAFNEHLENFMLHPRSLPNILRHLLWRTRNFLRFHLRPGGFAHTFFWRCRHPSEWRRPIFYRLALAAGAVTAVGKALTAAPRQKPWGPAPPAGISVVIPSRNGRHLLDALLPTIAGADEIIIVDNGTTDGTAEAFPKCVMVHSAEPLSFARAANLGIARARYSHVCLLNNDMIAEPGFLATLRRGFECVPDLFCATAQIFLPEGRRREETGKTAMPPGLAVADFPVRCLDPMDDEDHSYVLYGSGGCSLYDAVRLRALGGFDESYSPAYVEDLDLGVRAWQRGWPSVFCAGARVLHHHRATTARYYTAGELERALEINYLRFLARTIGSTVVFRRLWSRAIRRLNLRREWSLLAAACHAPLWVRPASHADDARILALGSGDVAVFPGRAPSGRPLVLIVSPYLPFPLSHGGAVRIYNLMRRAAPEFDLILVAFVEQPATPPPELREICVEVVTVRRVGTHALPSTARPETVEEFDHPAFHAALRQTAVKWRPSVAQLEFTQMAVYAGDCAPARTVLVEHDITYDLYAQLLAAGDDWELRRQHTRWLNFEPDAWSRVDRVVTMSEKDQGLITSKSAPGSVCIPNGVDTSRFTPGDETPEPGRVLFIGSFAHRPNVLAVEFFLREVWPHLTGVTLHVIAGMNHTRYLDLRHPGVEVEGFVADVRSAYRRAAVVVAPLVASAGTNIKILEAMAMGKAIVSTSAGINGLDVASAVALEDDPQAFALAITNLLADPARRRDLESRARALSERWDWDAIAAAQRDLWRDLT